MKHFLRRLMYLKMQKILPKKLFFFLILQVNRKLVNLINHPIFKINNCMIFNTLVKILFVKILLSDINVFFLYINIYVL